MAKAASLGADQIVLDLEDSCPPSEKDAARSAAVQALKNLDFGWSHPSVRINGLSTQWCERDVQGLARAAVTPLTLVVPKVEAATQVKQIDRWLDKFPADLTLELMLETPRGLINLREVALASQRTRALIFGPGDYAAALGVPQYEIGESDKRYPGHQWQWAMCELVNHARAAGLHAIDGPFGRLSDEEGFRTSALRARLLGYDGKWCIHPEQIPWANDAFSPDEAEVKAAERVFAAYRDAESRGEGAIALDGQMIDVASRRSAEAILEQAREASKRATGSSDR